MFWSKEHERLVGDALAQSRARLLADAIGLEIVFETIATAVEIDRRCHVLGGIGPRPPRSLALHFQHSSEERLEAAKQRMVDLAAGDDPIALFGLSSSVSPAELATMEAVNTVFRDCLRGRNQVRDWNILHKLAKGERGLAEVGKMGLKKSRISDIKIVQCGSIWVRVKHLMPEMQPSIVLKDYDLEEDR